MKFGLRYCNTGRYVDPARAVELAEAAEEAGFESMWTVEHTVVPGGYGSSYPYDTSGRMAGGQDDIPGGARALSRELTKDGLARGNPLDGVRPAEQLVEQEEMRRLRGACLDQPKQRLDFDDVVAFPADQIVGPADTTPHQEHRRLAAPGRLRPAALCCERVEGESESEI